MSPVSVQTIELAGQTVAYQLKRSRRRTIGFTISHDGLVVTAPVGLRGREVERALQRKSGWILDKLADWKSRPTPRSLCFEDGENLPWLGAERRLILQPEGIRTRILERDGAIVIRHDPDLAGELRTRTLTTALQRFYKREGAALMTPRVEYYAARLNRPVRKVIVRDQKRRWGSCAPDGTIRLNWRLMGFPEPLIDYVCAHEAAHLVEANHSPAYWRVVQSLMPDWKSRRQQMRDEADRWVAF